MSCHPTVRTGARTPAASFCGIALLISIAVPAFGQPVLSLNDALSRAIGNDPSAVASRARLEAANASVRQADIGPRPTLGVDLEDFAGSAPYGAFNSAQITAYYERTWERGGKREARVGVAQAEVEVARQRAAVRILDVVAKVQGAWVDAAAAEAAIAIADERVSVAERLDGEVQRRVSRALDPVFAGERAKAALAQARIAREQSVETARIARRSLASWWAGGDDFRVDAGSFLRVEDVAVRPESNPDVALLAAEREVASAGIRVAESNGVSDPTFRVGVRHFADGNGVALMVGGAIPLGVEGANRANVDRAMAQSRAADAEIAVSRLETRREIERLVADRARIVTEINRIETEVLPTAERAAGLVVQGYTRGGTAFTYLEMADAQRAVIDSRTRRVELLRQFHQDGVRLDRLSGRHVTLISGQEKK